MDNVGVFSNSIEEAALISEQVICYDKQDPDTSLNPKPILLNASRAKPEGASCPGNMGGKNWQPTAYDPNRNLYYIPVIESCAGHSNDAQKKAWEQRGSYFGGAPKRWGRITGSVTAMDPKSGKVVAKL